MPDTQAYTAWLALDPAAKVWRDAMDALKRMPRTLPSSVLLDLHDVLFRAGKVAYRKKYGDPTVGSKDGAG